MTRSENIRNILEIIGGLAVLASIILVGIEIRQNTQATRAATAHELYRDYSDRYQIPESILEILNKKASGIDLTAPEMSAERIYVSNIFRMFENQWYQNRIGILDDEIFLGYARTLGPVFRSSVNGPLYNDVFDSMKTGSALHPEFISFAEGFR